MTTVKNTIETKLNKSIDLMPASDGVNLLYTAISNGVNVANVYKSFDQNFKPTHIIRYVNIN